VKLDPSNFDYSLAKENGSDLRFVWYDSFGNIQPSSVDLNDRGLPYWIETWNPYNTSTSRIWVNIGNLDIAPESCGYIYMFHGYSDAETVSNGGATFDFFDDFSNKTIDNTKWDNYTDGQIPYINDGMLILKDQSGVKTNNINIGMTGIVETKARATLSTTGIIEGEASMFVRENLNMPDDTPDCAHVFSSAFRKDPFLAEDTNLAVVLLTSTDVNNPPLTKFPNYNWYSSFLLTGGTPPLLNQEWKRLTFIVNDSDYTAIRYNYEEFTYEGHAEWNDSKYLETNPSFTACRDGSFGLCILESDLEAGAKAQYDWVYLRKFAMNTASDVTTVEEQIPTASLNGTISKYFYWENTNGLESDFQPNADQRSADFVYYDIDMQERTFVIKGLDLDEEYSIIFIMGNTSRNINYRIDNVQVNVHISNLLQGYSNPMRIITLPLENFTKNWLVAKAANLDGDTNNGYEIEISFKDDPGSPDFWNICSMTIEKGIRTIKIE
jgi:hypothetical protein